MSIIYDPTAVLKKIAPDRKIEKLVSKKLTLNKAALSFVDDLDFIKKKDIASVALKTVKGYKERIKKEVSDGAIKSEAVKEIASDPVQLIQRVKNEIVWQVKESIKESYAGEFYTWLPSDADEPDPEHQLNYGKVFQVGDGEMPGDRIGCRCGMEILVDGSKLEL